jgi:hypothetical protein
VGHDAKGSRAREVVLVDLGLLLADSERGLANPERPQPLRQRRGAAEPAGAAQQQQTEEWQQHGRSFSASHRRHSGGRSLEQPYKKQRRAAAEGVARATAEGAGVPRRERPQSQLYGRILAGN